ncbi:DUF6233 domain-containing protein [Streptomyces sp. NPDC015171]|uniref:DUF6233 domain-containing protein n=1 Tax=Streptomyces sp. NPDC015171 TaxID=3364945 RepID=UPI0037027F3E
MPQLPPDPPRLRAILTHLDRQIAENATIGIYLRLQRDTVQQALTRAERPPGPRRPTSRTEDGRAESGRAETGRAAGDRVKGGGAKGSGAPPGLGPPPARTGFVVQQKRTPTAPEPALIHLADCTMIEGTPHRIRSDEARAALTDPAIAPCPFCRPDTELGIDLA